MNVDLDRLAVDTIRTLAMDAVQAANSGHPGTPMALAPVIHAIWSDFLRQDPQDPRHPGRDRFVLSAGHASMLLYAVLHLHGQGIRMEDIRRFRQLGSPCAGHPEYGHTPFAETTTGPLGQGFANSVGMAIARHHMAARYDRPGRELFDWRVLALGGDGDLMEGVAIEAAALAGHLGLDALTWIWDSNRITIEGSTDLAFSEDVPARFRAMGWEVETVEDANDLAALRAALGRARHRRGRPGLIVVKSVIAWGAPKLAGSHEAHGAPLGEAEVRGAKQAYGFDPDRHFVVDEALRATLTAGLEARAAAFRRGFADRLEAYRRAEPAVAAEIEAFFAGNLPAGLVESLPRFPADAKGMAGRQASGRCLQAIAKGLPWLIGGSADLGPSNKTEITGGGDFLRENHAGRNLHFGVREHAMGAIANGLALCGMRAYTGTFFVFSDYMRPVHRLAGLMQLPVTWIYTHDSIGVGEDGPTHQPIEQLPSLRAVPGIDVYRPGDANEVTEAWRRILETGDRPAALLLSRQDLPTLDRTRFAPAEGVRRGGYVLADAPGGRPELILLATGSELALAVAAFEKLVAAGRRPRLVSLPCWELFSRQDEAYREEVLPDAVDARVAVEAASPFGWERWVGRKGAVIGMRGFGASAPGKVLFEHFGFTVEALVAAAEDQLARTAGRSGAGA